MKKAKIILQVFFIVAFALLLIAPFIGFLILPEANVSNENRKLTGLPEQSFTKEYFQDFELYFNDRFPNRQKFIAKNAEIKIKYFKVSPFPDKVQIGNDGFLFINTDEALKSYSRRDLLTTDDLNKFVDKIVKKDSLLKARGISYYFGYFPNKHNIYIEKLPKAMRVQIRDTISLATQLKKGLSLNGFTLFEPSVYPERKEALRYLKLDTHWSNLGSFQAYQDFFKTFTELDVTPYKYNDFRWRNVHQRFGDLTKLAGLDSIGGYEEYRPLSDLKSQSNKYVYDTLESLPPRAIRTTNNSIDAKQKKLLVFGDSYSNNMIPFYSLHFKEVIYLRDEYNQQMVDSIKPNIVLEVSVERFLYKHI